MAGPHTDEDAEEFGRKNSTMSLEIATATMDQENDNNNEQVSHHPSLLFVVVVVYRRQVDLLLQS